jgi:hypothetical protein
LRDYVSRLISTKLTWRIQMLAELAALRHPVFAPIV